MKLGKQQVSTIFVIFVMVLGFVMSRFKGPDTPTAQAPSTPTSTVKTVDREPVQTVSSTLPVIRRSKSVSTTAMVTNVVDGDTVDLLFDGEEKVMRVRLLGINTPESVDPRRPVQCFGKEASKHMRELVLGKRIAAVSDIKADDRDKYGRLLRGLVMEDGTDVNATLVAQGYAYAYLDFPLDKQRKAQLRQIQAEAQAEKRGLWNEMTCNGKTEAPPSSL